MYRRILAPIDGSRISLSALDQAIVMAKAFNAGVTVVFVIDPYPFTGVGPEFAYGQDQYQTAARAEAKAALEMAHERLRDAGIAADTRIVEARSPSRGIIESIKETGADLVVMGSHGRRGLERLVLGSVTQNVLAKTEVATLVVRSPDDI